MLQLGAPGLDPARPAFKLLLAVAALVSTSGTVQAYIRKVRGYLQGRLESGQLEDAECPRCGAAGFRKPSLRSM